jgi:hypothetical protein
VWTERDEVGQLADRGEFVVPEHLDRGVTTVLRQVQLNRLDEARQVGNHEDRFVFVLSHERQYFAVLGMQELDAAASERLIALAERDQPLHPPQQRLRVGLLCLNVDGRVVVLRVGDDWEVEPL